MKIDFKKIEKKWQKKWEVSKCFEAKQLKEGNKFYVMEMFPYPSALGLHLGHALNYTIGDILARFKRMNGFNVLYPMGFDALGLPAENAAIQAGEHPHPYTAQAIKNYIKQMKGLGLSYDWSKMISSMEPEYYKWNQFFFLKFLENGLAYRKKAAVNWCPKCNTVLANEQVVGGCCWRHEDTEVEIRHLEQWFLRTTKYADELLDCIDDLQWPEKIKIMQKNWIGKSHGTEIDFEIETENSDGKISNVVIVHGCPDKKGKFMSNEERAKQKNWRLWTKENLEKKGIKVDLPLMPEPWEPDYEKFKREFEKYKINENSVLIGTSCGCAFLVRWLGETKKKIKKLILVAPWKIVGGNKPKKHFEIRKKFYNFDIDEMINKSVGEVVFFTSNNESDLGKESLKLYQNILKGKVVSLKNHGHYTLSDMGGDIEFPELLDEILSDSKKQKFSIFTTRPDTIYGVTFMVISAQHPKLMELVTADQEKEVGKFLRKIKSTKQEDMDKLDKEGVFTGSYAINPVTNEKVPIWAGNFVIADYGSGMVMGVPAHDQRDFEFAKKYGIDIRQVVAKKGDLVRSVIWDTEKENSYLENLGVKVVEIREQKLNGKLHFIKRIEFDKKTIPSFEKFVIKKLKPYYWYEYICSKGIFFIFRKSDGEIEKLELTPSNEQRINHLTAECFAEKLLDKVPRMNIWKFLATTENRWYHDLIVHTSDGVLINSSQFNGMNNREAIDEITKYLIKKKLARKSVQFKLRDWLISRQRYWGTPIPIIYCDKCGIVPIPEKDLPVKLPMDVKFGKGNPLATNEKFVNVKCPKCGGKARRETDTMDTFVDSSWYFMRYPDNKNDKEPFSKGSQKWLPVDQYIGGIEHATMHLIYARFWTKALRDLGYVNYDEPFTKLFNQGMLHGENGEKMSKSKGNVILPEVVSEKYGIDTARFFLMSLAAPDKAREWSDKGVEGSLKFIKKVMNYFEEVKIGTQGCTPNNIQKNIVTKGKNSDARIESKLNKTIKEITEDIENFRYNLAVIKIRELFQSLPEKTSKDVLEKSLKLLHPFCPHITEELWEKIGNKNFVSLEKWPIADEKKIDESFEKQEEAIRKLKMDIEQIKKLTGKTDAKIYVYVLPNEIEIYKNVEGVELFAVNDKKKYDPENKSKKVKPGKPGIYLE